MKAIRAYALGYPFLLPLALYSTWVAGRLSLGHWPRPSLDDPGSIGLWVDIPCMLTGVLLVLGLPAFLAAVTVLAHRAFHDAAQRKNLLATAAVSVVLMIAVTLFLRWDPWRVGDWFMD
jgi:hypothetical protein